MMTWGGQISGKARVSGRHELAPTEHKRPEDGQQEDDTPGGEMQVPAKGGCRSGRQVPNGRGGPENGTLRRELCTGSDGETSTTRSISTMCEVV